MKHDIKIIATDIVNKTINNFSIKWKKFDNIIKENDPANKFQKKWFLKL